MDTAETPTQASAPAAPATQPAAPTAMEQFRSMVAETTKPEETKKDEPQVPASKEQQSVPPEHDILSRIPEQYRKDPYILEKHKAWTQEATRKFTEIDNIKKAAEKEKSELEKARNDYLGVLKTLAGDAEDENSQGEKSLLDALAEDPKGKELLTIVESVKQQQMELAARSLETQIMTAAQGMGYTRDEILALPEENINLIAASIVNGVMGTDGKRRTLTPEQALSLVLQKRSTTPNPPRIPASGTGKSKMDEFKEFVEEQKRNG